jgi:shikimate dehydrogenase
MLTFGLIGYPLEHSLSPRLHAAALQAMSLDGEYRLFPVPPLPEGAAELEELVAKLRRGRLTGSNVTVPHKQDVMAYLDATSPTAAAIGAANTLYLRNGRLSGENTDAPGFIADLDRVLEYRRSTGWLDQGSSTQHALILGAGGSARAVAYALLAQGWQVTVAARRLEQAAELATSVQRSVDGEPSLVVGDHSSSMGGRVEPIELQYPSVFNLLSEITLVVNATPVGMWPQVDASPWPAGLALPEGALVYDLVYNPVETAFLKMARGAGLPTANGLGMLIEQAALALELWTGRKVPRASMWEAVTEFKLEGFIQGDRP